MICLILSIVGISSCKFAQAKAGSIKVKYGIFSMYFPTEDECKTYDDIDSFDTSSEQKWAQSLAIITILILTSSIICVSVLLCRTFSRKIKILNQILLVIAFGTSTTVSVLMYQESIIYYLKTTCLAGDDGCDFSAREGGIVHICVHILLIITLIISWIHDCKNNDTS